MKNGKDEGFLLTTGRDGGRVWTWNENVCVKIFVKE